MTISRGQIYQFNLIPETFYIVQRVYSANQVLLLDADIRFQVFFTQTRLLTTCTLVPYLPENRVHNSLNLVTGIGGTRLSFALTTPFVSGSVQSHSTVPPMKATAPTYLRGKLRAPATVVKAEVINPVVLRGRVFSICRARSAFYSEYSLERVG